MSEPYHNGAFSGIREFFRLEASAGILLLIAALLALIASNTRLAEFYDLFLQIPVEIRLGALHIAKPLLLWINDGLMAIFFLLVGLEIKRELREGELSTTSQAMLPGVAAVGGMLVPALIYVSLNSGDPMALRGWAIPAATDIAFALGVLTLLGRSVPVSLKVFLVALAIIDDLGAIIIIALFYTGDLSVLALLLGLGVLLIMLMLNRLGVTRIAPYALLGIVLWVLVLKSGVHATLAGVATAFAIPLTPRDDTGFSPLTHLEHILHPWVAFLVMPLFGFANAGVSFAGVTLASLAEGIPLGIAAGLFIGKQLGAFGFAWAAIRLGWTKLPEGAGWLSFYATCMLAGIGFTMSLFIGTLAWESSDYAAPVRLGVLIGSLASGVIGYLLLRIAGSKRISAPTVAE
ncbi:Na+/H+ antiporter NhaA [Virgifigura deserti]|uniref:Na+/H+ antiporter NhaA n=1 Tax=Virgifigura deserti TaxID=2268457 RepID=UPI003CCBE482